MTITIRVLVSQRWWDGVSVSQSSVKTAGQCFTKLVYHLADRLLNLALRGWTIYATAGPLNAYGSRFSMSLLDMQVVLGLFRFGYARMVY